jgi:tetratricopeptide (TPR) repeat protein
MPAHDTQVAIELLNRGDLGGAEACCRRALDVEPGNVTLQHVLGVLYARTGRLPQALALLESVAAQHPDRFELHNSLGNLLRNVGRGQEAAASFRRALALKSDFFPAHLNLGNALQDAGQLQAAIESYRSAVALCPDSAVAHNNLGNALVKHAELAAGLAELRRAADLDPRYADARVNLSFALTQAGSFPEAERAARDALSLQGASAEAHCSLGLALSGQDRPAEAIDCFRAAVQRRPDYAEALLNLGTALLGEAQFAEGWRLYEYRFLADPRSHPPTPAGVPRWDGDLHTRGTIVVVAEQGRGDSIQFVRFGGLLRARGIRCVLECEPALVQLLSSAGGFASVVPYGAAADREDCAWIALLSLPGLFNTDLGTLPAYTPYLRADPARVRAWGERLGGGSAGLRVGLAWRGRPDTETGSLRGRSVPARELAALADLGGVEFVSLQQAATDAELAAIGPGIRSFGEALDGGADAFVDTAALMMHLDLIVTCDTSIAHLAGALGRPVWVALHRTPSFRWLRGRPDSPWYPSMRLFRQTEADRWGAVFQAMRAQLADMRGA